MNHHAPLDSNLGIFVLIIRQLPDHDFKIT